MGSATSALCRRWRCSRGAPCCCWQPCRCHSTGPVGEGVVRWPRGAGTPPFRSPSHPAHPGPADPRPPFPFAQQARIHAYCVLDLGVQLLGEMVTPSRKKQRWGKEKNTLFPGGRIPVGLSEEVASEAYTASAGCAPDGGVTHAGPGAGRKQGAGDTKANGTGAEGERELV